MPIINTVIAGGGTTPTGTKSITANGVYDVTNFASADVQVPTTAPTYYVEKTKDANNKLVNGSTFINLSGVTDLGDYVLEEAYRGSSLSGALDLSSLTTITGQKALYQTFWGQTGITSVDMSNVTSITGQQAMLNCFRDNTGITSVDLSSLTTVSNRAMDSTFHSCRGIVSLNLSSLTTVSGGQAMQYAFTYCFPSNNPINITLSSLTTVSGDDAMAYFFQGAGVSSVSLPLLKTISSGSRQMMAFLSDSAVTSVNMPSLEEASGQYCLGSLVARTNNIVTMGFPSLSVLTGSGVFNSCFFRSAIQSVWFYALNPSSFGSYTNQFNSMFSQVSNATVHFPIAIQSTIGSWSDVTGGFGGTNTTVLFDIVTSLTGADGNTYTRKEKESTSSATAWVYNDTLYYTSGVSNHTAGVNEPVVNDTIYSDAACTTAVTTISSIA